MPERSPERAPVMALAMIGATICLLSVAIAAAGAPAGEKFGRGMFALLVVGVPLVAGLYALGTPTGMRFGIGLLALSCACSLAGLAVQSGSIPYTVGRLSGWAALTLVYWLLLSFPDGRVHGQFERGLAIATVAVVGLGFFGAALFVESFPQHTPWASCDADCPANAVFLLSEEPGVMDTVVMPVAMDRGESPCPLRLALPEALEHVVTVYPQRLEATDEVGLISFTAAPNTRGVFRGWLQPS